MDLNLCVFASFLLVSVGAVRFDRGPQRFTEEALPQLERQASDTDGVVLYLTSDQIRALEASGAVVRPAESGESAELTDETNDKDTDYTYRYEHEEHDKQETPHSEEPDDDEHVEEVSDAEDNGNVDLDEILRILNEEELLDEEEKSQEQVLHELQIEERTTEEPRVIPPRFLARQKQQDQNREDRYTAPSDKKVRSKIYSAIRYQQPQKPRSFSLPQVEELVESEEQTQEEMQRLIPVPVQKFRLVPYEVEENVEESLQRQVEESLQKQEDEQVQQEDLEQLDPQEQSVEVTTEKDNSKKSALLSPLPKKLSKAIDQRKNRLYQDELALQAALRELKQVPKYSDQKYVTEIEKLRANLEKQNALAKVEAIVKSAPQLIKKDQIKESARKPEKTNSKILKPVTVTKPYPVPKTKKVETERPSGLEQNVSVPVTRKIYVKVNKPYFAEHAVPVEIRKDGPQYPTRKNEKITILRHVWEH